MEEVTPGHFGSGILITQKDAETWDSLTKEGSGIPPFVLFFGMAAPCLLPCSRKGLPLSNLRCSKIILNPDLGLRTSPFVAFL